MSQKSLLARKDLKGNETTNKAFDPICSLIWIHFKGWLYIYVIVLFTLMHSHSLSNLPALWKVLDHICLKRGCQWVSCNYYIWTNKCLECITFSKFYISFWKQCRSRSLQAVLFLMVKVGNFQILNFKNYNLKTLSLIVNINNFRLRMVNCLLIKLYDNKSSIMSLTQEFEADFPQKVSLISLN